MAPAIPRRKVATGGWVGSPFSAQCLRKIADDAGVQVVAQANFEAAAEAINFSFISFDLATQVVSPPGETRQWFAAVAEKADDLIRMFGEYGTDQRDLAIRNFVERPSAWMQGGFIKPEFQILLDGIAALRRTAEIAAEIQKTKETGHRTNGTPNDVLQGAFCEAWHKITGKEYPSVTKPQQGPPASPFILFTSRCLAVASTRLANTGLAPICPQLLALSGQPHTIARWAGTKGRKLPKK